MQQQAEAEQQRQTGHRHRWAGFIVTSANALRARKHHAVQLQRNIIYIYISSTRRFYVSDCFSSRKDFQSIKHKLSYLPNCSRFILKTEKPHHQTAVTKTPFHRKRAGKQDETQKRQHLAAHCKRRERGEDALRASREVPEPGEPRAARGRTLHPPKVTETAAPIINNL